MSARKMTERKQITARIDPNLWARIKNDPSYGNMSAAWITETALTRLADELNGENRRAVVSERLTAIETRLEQIEKAVSRIDGKVSMSTLLLWAMIGVDVAKITTENVEEYRKFEREFVGA